MEEELAREGNMWGFSCVDWGGVGRGGRGFESKGDLLVRGCARGRGKRDAGSEGPFLLERGE